MFYHKKCKTVAGSKHYDEFTPTDAQNTMGTKLMLVHRKLMIAEYHRPIILREPLSVSAANLKYLLIKLRQIYNQWGKAYARKHCKSIDKCHMKNMGFVLANNSSTKLKLVTSKNALVGLQEWILILNYKISSVLP